MSKSVYRMLVFSFFCILISLGVFIGFTYQTSNNASNVEKIEDEEKIEKIKKSNVYDEVNSVVANIYTEDILVEITYNYLGCNEKINKSVNEYQTSMECLKEKYYDFEVISEDNNILKLSKTINTNCPNHFLVKLLDDNIVIYKVIAENELELFKNTEIHINTIRDEAKEEFKEGIYVDGVVELNSIIEDLNS